MIAKCGYLNIAFFFLSSVMSAVPCTVSSAYRFCFSAACSNSSRKLGGCQLALFYDVHTETGIKHAAAAVDRCVSFGVLSLGGLRTALLQRILVSSEQTDGSIAELRLVIDCDHAFWSDFARAAGLLRIAA